jgi:hypothetical protein
MRTLLAGQQFSRPINVELSNSKRPVGFISTREKQPEMLRSIIQEGQPIFALYNPLSNRTVFVESN